MDDINALRQPRSARAENNRVFVFADFRFSPGSRSLLRNGKPVRLGARAFDILLILIEHAGEVVAKAELFDRVWPGVFVDESSLRVHVAALRRALGDSASGGHIIASVPGRGYSFVAPVRDEDRAGAPESEMSNPAAGGRPAALETIFGRDDIVRTLARRLPLKRFITLTGPGGIGKTAVALAVADEVAAYYRDGVRVVDLAPLTYPDEVAPHVASLLRISAPNTEPLQALAAQSGGRNLLIVLDNCEHVVDAASAIAEAILGAAPETHIVATSREPLRARGEWTQRLEPLPLPPADMDLTIAALGRFPACALFLERWAACDGSIEPGDEDAQLVADICRKLDGVPLAIELAAARASLFGLRGLRERLDDRFAILTKSPRSAAPRHRTLAATIDWSFETLGDDERKLWRRLGVMRDAFTLEAAETLGLDGLDDFSIVEILDSLVEKSLVAIDARGGETRYRLLESLRLYAFDKLVLSGELECARRRHAEYWLARSIQGGDGWTELPTQGWLLANGGNIADIRAALDWALGSTGDPALAIGLVTASAPIWFKMLMIPELRRYLERAFALAAQRPDIEPRLIMRMHVAHAHAIFHTLGHAAEVRAALEAAATIAERLGDRASLAHILWALFGCSSVHGDYAAMTSAVERFDRLERGDGGALIHATHERMAAWSDHLMGRNEQALRHAEAALALPAVRIGDGGVMFDHTLTTTSHYCRILWALGRPNAAAEVIDEAIARTLAVNQPFALGYFLNFAACPIALWSGRIDAFRHYVALLFDESIGIPLTVWRKCGELYRQMLVYLTDPDRAEATRLALAEAPLTASQAERLSTFDWRLLRPECVQDAMAGRINWSTPEILRAQGETLLAVAPRAARPEAESLFLRAIDLSRAHKALSWELRAATGLATLWREGGRKSQAEELLSDVVERFGATEDTADLRAARSLLDGAPRR
jgi:predicted ATPase/DNA-binding winged helix-turn-helix (wHTH) protein